ncbi:MAG: alcohol dehydrogenase catalytic domain-containing protein [Chloroflexota bacterium]|nr:alcohol dehydrogenase catalytic domain-containing protein [Chloroflexota bacterium]
MTAVITTTMGAVRYHGPGEPFHYEQVPIPRPRPDQALVRVGAAGICHTELHLRDGTLNLGVAPLVPGHEIAGTVAAVGEGVTATRPGERVAVYYYAGCGRCAWCRKGQENLCRDVVDQFGFTADGGYAEYVAVPARNLVPLPDGLALEAAAALGCSGTTALHAVRAVADVRLGETVVVYGVGAVGYALIQLCRLAGARVIAVGRTPAKLARAAELGADVTINADELNPAVEALRLTGDEGADVVFELVGITETMERSVAMLRRRGRLVFIGYSQDRLLLNPLQFVVKELQIRAAVGNTYDELAEVIRLAGEGRLHATIDRTIGLDAVPAALDDLKAGRVAGRVVIVPGVATPPPERRPSEAERLDADILALIAEGLDAPPDDERFEALALRLFAYQFAHNEPYRKYALRKGRTPETVRTWRDIPAVPIAAFKATTLACEPTAEAAAVFMSSGTTGGPERRSRHYHPHLRLYDASVRATFAGTVVPDVAPGALPMLALFPPPATLPNSSLAYWLALVMREFGAPDSRFVMTETGLDLPGIVRALREAERAGTPLCLLGASFSFVHLFDALEADGLRFALPAGSRVMDTGGFKGQSREVGRGELYALVRNRLGVPRERCVNMYGMTEHSTQFIDSTIRDDVLGRSGPRHKIVPTWARTLVVDPETLEELPPGEIGLLLHYDLGNRNSALAVLSEDTGYALGGGFELLGRARGAEARGCSVAIDELLSAVGQTGGQR